VLVTGVGKQRVHVVLLWLFTGEVDYWLLSLRDGP
jgi:hypothetical protein